MNIQRTDIKLGADYKDIKNALKLNKQLLKNNTDPIREWQTWIDLTDEDLQKLTSYLLFELVFNEALTSITKIIPLVENNDLKVGVTMYIDENSIYASNQIKDDFTPLFISTNDLVNVLKKLLNEYKSNGMDYAVREVIFKLSHELRIINEVRQ